MGGKRAAVDVACTPSPAGHPEVPVAGTVPEMVMLSPGCAVVGVTATLGLPVAAAGVTLRTWTAPALTPPQRTPIVYDPTGVVAGMVRVA